MPTIEFQQNAYGLNDNETVLECLLRNGHSIPNSCRAGACQACLLKASTGDAPLASTQALKSTLAAQGYFLACICRPETDLSVQLSGDEVRVPSHIVSISMLSHDVALVHIAQSDGFAFRAGQYVTLIRDDGLARSYSIAGLPTGNASPGEHAILPIHVRSVPNGRFSGWLHREARPGDAIHVQGPAGNCFYTDGSPQQSLLLAGTGTGLAPLYGIIQDALQQGHTGPIWLFHGALKPEGLYLRSELEALARQHTNFHYVPSVLNVDEASLNDAETTPEVGRIEEVIQRLHPKLNGWRAFVCGDPNIVGTLKMKLFLAGVSNREIFADAFLQSPQA